MKNPYFIIGIIDNYGAIHYQAIESSDETHETFWPGKNKRWRFNIREWDLQKSVLSCADFTAAECEDICALMRRKFTPPDWFLSGEIWEKHGRPHKGKKYAAYQKELKEKGLE